MGRNKGHHAPAGQIEVSAHIFRPIQCQQSQWIKSKARCEAGKEGECESNYKVSKTCSSLSLHLNIIIFYSQPPITSTQVSAQASYMVYSQQNSLTLPQTLSLAPLTNHFIPTQQQYSITPYTSHPPPSAHYYPYMQQNQNLPATYQTWYPSLLAPPPKQSYNYPTYNQSLYTTSTNPPATHTSPPYPQPYHTLFFDHRPQPRALTSLVPSPPTSTFDHYHPAL